MVFFYGALVAWGLWFAHGEAWMGLLGSFLCFLAIVFSRTENPSRRKDR